MTHQHAPDGDQHASEIVVDELADYTPEQVEEISRRLGEALGANVHVVEAVAGPRGGTFSLHFGRYASEVLGADIPNPRAGLGRAMEGVIKEVERITAQQAALTTGWTAQEWEALRKRLALENIPPQGRVLNAEELRWLALFCPSCYKSRQDCECIWP